MYDLFLSISAKNTEGGSFRLFSINLIKNGRLKLSEVFFRSRRQLLAT
jgi:hypothetical protein